MIADAYTQRCTCHDEQARGLLSCPVHGAAFPPVGRITDLPLRQENQGTAAPHCSPTRPPPEVHSNDYTLGMQRGFKEGVEAAMKLMGV